MWLFGTVFFESAGVTLLLHRQPTKTIYSAHGSDGIYGLFPCCAWGSNCTMAINRPVFPRGAWEQERSEITVTTQRFSIALKPSSAGEGLG